MRKSKYNLEDYDVTRSMVYNLIDEYIFNERDRGILKRRLTDGITYEKLSEEFDLSVPQIKNIIRKGESKLFRHIK